MTFCTNCGNAIHDGSRFCTSCGQPAVAPSATVIPTPTPTPTPTPAPPQTPAPAALDYSIEGGNLQVIRIRLKPGQEIYAEAGKMIYKQSQVVWETRMSGDTLGEKIWGAFKRKLMGESLFLTYFHSSVPGEIGFAGTYPGKIQVFDLKPNQSVFVQRDSFLVAQSTTQLNIAFVKRLGVGLFGGEGFILEKLTGPGAVFIHAGGDFIEFSLGAGETLQVDTGCIVAFDEGVSYDIQMVGGIRTAMFGGEGLFLATLTGPGRVIIQSMTLEKMRRELAPFRTGGDSHKGLDAITGIFDNDD